MTAAGLSPYFEGERGKTIVRGRVDGEKKKHPSLGDPFRRKGNCLKLSADRKAALSAEKMASMFS